MPRSPIFIDMDKLSPRYIPKILRYREDQMSFLSDLYHRALDQVGGEFLRVCQLIGPVGTGKTSAREYGAGGGI